MNDRENYSWLKHIDFILIDILSLILSFFISYRMKFESFDFWDRGSWTSFVAIICIAYLLITLFWNPYSGILRRRFYEEIFRTVLLTIYNFLGVSMFLYVFKMGAMFSREVFIVMYVLFFFISLVLKYIWKRNLKVRFFGAQKKLIPLMVVATKDNIENAVVNAMAGDTLKYELKAVYVVDSENATLNNKEYEETVVLGKNEDFIKYILNNEINEVYFTVTPALFSKNQYQSLIENGIVVQLDIEAMLGLEADEQIVNSVGACKSLALGRYTFSWKQKMYFIFKRLFDIIFGLLGCIVILPVALIVKLCYLAKGDKGAIFYTQKRIGKDGKAIQIYKFRSMVMNAGEMLEEMLKDEKYKEEWERNQKFEDDPRITPIGKILRKTSLDEVPQFINVLKGDMSVVGPRPLIPGELEMHNGIKLYNMLKPGITGWWGCNGRSNIEYKERLELEYYYVKNCSLYLDCLCIIRTAFAVLEKDGAK